MVSSDRVLLLQRPRKKEVRLPKGHVEPGESFAECAVREVGEESGLHEVVIQHFLGTVENRFAYRGARCIRHETWFLMTTSDETCGEHEAQWRPTWYLLEHAEAALSFESERIALRWAWNVLRRQHRRGI